MFTIPILLLKSNATRKRQLVGCRNKLASAPHSRNKEEILNPFKRVEADIEALESEVRQFIKLARHYLESEKGVGHGR
jgi:hypothetical protein